MCGLYSHSTVHFSLCLTLVRLVRWLKDKSWKSGQRWLLFALYSWPPWARQKGGFSSHGSTNWQAKSLLSVCCRDKNDFAEQQSNCVTPNDNKPICTVFGTRIHSNKPLKKREARLNSQPWLLYALTHRPQTHPPFAAPPRMSSADSGPALPLLLLPALPVPELQRWSTGRLLCVCVCMRTCLVDWEGFSFLVCVDTF